MQTVMNAQLTLQINVFNAQQIIIYRKDNVWAPALPLYWNIQAVEFA